MALTLQAGHFGGARGGFRIVFGDGDQAPRGHIIYLAPFGEEMNRCRQAAATQARLFAASGYRCSLLDLYGTGEAVGELADATLEDWIAGIHAAVEECRDDEPLVFWGCRLGACLMTRYLAQHPAPGAVTALLWQPQVSGKTFITQAIRQRAAARMEQGLEKQSKDEVMAMLADGATLEVGGYAMSAPLVHAIETLDIAEPLSAPLKTVHWLEHDTGDGRPIAARTQKAMDALKDHSETFELHRFAGAPFWQLHERDSCEALVEASTSCLS